MVVKRILYHPEFLRDLRKLDRTDQRRAIRVETLFLNNPLHPSLRLHGLKGKLRALHSISVTMRIRIIFKRMGNGDIVFLSIGQHDIYRSLR